MKSKAQINAEIDLSEVRLSRRDAAHYLGVTINSVLYYVKKGWLKEYKWEGAQRYYFLLPDLIRLKMKKNPNYGIEKSEGNSQ